jgi:hypothetical protein
MLSSELQIDYEWLLMEACEFWTYESKQGKTMQVCTFLLHNFKGRDFRVDFTPYASGSYANIRPMGTWDDEAGEYSNEGRLGNFWLGTNGIPRDVKENLENRSSRDKQEIDWRHVWTVIHASWLMKNLNDELKDFILNQKAEVIE